MTSEALMAIPTSHTAASAAAPGATPATAPLSLPARVLGVLFSPRRTYADVAAHPRWLGVFIVIVALTSAVGTAFLSTEVGRNAVIDQQITQSEAYGRQLNQTQTIGSSRYRHTTNISFPSFSCSG